MFLYQPATLEFSDGNRALDKDAKVVLDLTGTANRDFKTEVGAGLSTLTYEGSQTDLAGAVERAIYELRQQGRSDSRRATVIVTDGILDLGSRSATAVSTNWLRENLAVEAKRANINIFPILNSQAADYQLALSLAHTTGGEYYRALEPSLLPRNSEASYSVSTS